MAEQQNQNLTTNTEMNLQKRAEQFLEILLRGSSITTYELKRRTVAQILESTRDTLVDVGAKVNPEVLLSTKKVKTKGLFTGEFLAYFKDGEIKQTPIYEHRLATDPEGDWYTNATQVPFVPSDKMHEAKPTAAPANCILGLLNGQGEIDKNSTLLYNGSPNENQTRGDEYKVSVLIDEGEQDIQNYIYSQAFKEFAEDMNGTYKITIQGFVEAVYPNPDKSKDENGNFRYQDINPETGKGMVLYIVLKGVQASIRLHSDDPRKKTGLKVGWEKGRKALEEYERLEASKGISDHIAGKKFEESFPPEKYDQTQAEEPGPGSSVGDALKEASQTMKQQQRSVSKERSQLSEILDEDKLRKFSHNNAQRDRALVALATKTQEDDNKFIRAAIEGGYQNLVGEATELILNANQEVCTSIANVLEDAVEDGELLGDFLEEKKAELPQPKQEEAKTSNASGASEATGVSDETLDALIAESEGKVQQERKEESSARSNFTLSSYTKEIKQEQAQSSEQEFDEDGNPIGVTNFVDIGGEDDLFDDEDDD